jgi:hypothetical protein
MTDSTLHAVKEAAVADALRRFGVRSGAVAKRLFQPLPLTEQGPGLIRSGWDAWKNRHSQGLNAIPAAAAKGLWRSTKGFGRGVAEIAREMTMGSPFEVAKELKNHYAQTGSIPKTIGRQMSHFYLHPNAGLLNHAFSAGLPAMDLYQATQDPEHRGERMGGSIAGLAVSPFTARLGIPGALIQQPIQNLGRRIGRHFDSPTYTSNAPNESFGNGPDPIPLKPTYS